MRQWRLDYPSLAAVNPNLVMISITPFGQTGPYSDWNGCDLNAFHLTGASSRYCGRPQEPPLEHGTFAADFYGATAAAAWGLAAVYGSRRVGGQHLDVSCAEVIAAVFVGCQNIGAYAQDGKFDRRTGVGMSLGAPATILPCKDGHVWILALETGQWNGLARVMGNPEWMQLEMFQEMFVRAQNADAMYPLIEQWTMEHSKWEIMEKAQAAGCPVTAVFTVAEAAEHPHLKAREYIVEVDHPMLGKIRDLGAPFKLPESPGGPRRPAPLLGQHNAEVYGELLGMTIRAADWKTMASSRRGRHGTPGNRITGIDSRSDPLGPQSRRIAPEGRRALPLQGIRVANFGWVWAGPVVGQTLGFLGAEVYKIESRARIDLTRMLPPFAGGVRDPDRSISNHAGWAGNGSVSLNLKKPEAQELARQLIATCDVVVENFGPGVMKDMHLGYEELRAVKPDIVMFSMPAAGLYGPLKDVRTYGLSLSSITGLDSLDRLCRRPADPVRERLRRSVQRPHGRVRRPGGAAATVTAPARDSTSTTRSKRRSCRWSARRSWTTCSTGASPGRWATGIHSGWRRRTASSRAPARTAGSASPWPPSKNGAVCERRWAIPAWAQAPEFATPAARVENIDALHERLAEWTRAFNDYELAHLLQRHGVAAAPVLNVADLLHDPHYRARGTFIEVTHPLGFRETIYGAYVKTSRTEPDDPPRSRASARTTTTSSRSCWESPKTATASSSTSK